MSTRTQRSPEADAYRPLYKRARWRNIRERQFRDFPLCERHLKQGQVVVATVCHHTKPELKASPLTFYEGPFQSLCPSCHNSIEQSAEKLGYEKGVDTSGQPIDAAHPWNR